MKIPNRQQAIVLFFKAIDHDDPYWIDLVEDFYEEEPESWPNQFHVGKALGFTTTEMESATGMEPGTIEKLGLL